LLKKVQKFPARTRRNCSAFELKQSFEQWLGGAGNTLKVQSTFKVRWIAGRIVGILDDGFVLQDESGRVDLYFDEEVNVGDIVEVKVGFEDNEVGGGSGALTPGELRTPGVFQDKPSVLEICVLVPCTADFFIRKSDPNYKKMVVDRLVGEKFLEREKIVDSIRDFFKERKFNEVDTPQMVRLPGMEPYLDVFKTEFIDMEGEEERMFLITSPEYALKKLLVGGYEKVFQICKSFRNKETDSNLHNPEFTLLEWYRSYASYEEIMKDTEELVESLAIQKNGKAKIVYQGREINVETPWPRKRVKDLFKELAGIDYPVFENTKKLFEAAREKGYRVESKHTYDDVFFIIFMNEIEPKLGFEKPVIVYEYPVSMAALSKKCEGDEKYAERFEAYVAGVELCNAFTELNDPVEQKKRLELEREERKKLGKIDYPVDQSFISALEFGMPPAGGNALGVDRLVMLLTDSSDIRDVVMFPFRDL